MKWFPSSVVNTVWMKGRFLEKVENNSATHLEMYSIYKCMLEVTAFVVVNSEYSFVITGASCERLAPN